MVLPFRFWSSSVDSHCSFQLLVVLTVISWGCLWWWLWSGWMLCLPGLLASVLSRPFCYAQSNDTGLPTLHSHTFLLVEFESRRQSFPNVRQVTRVARHIHTFFTFILLMCRPKRPKCVSWEQSTTRVYLLFIGCALHHCVVIQIMTW